MMPGVSDVSKSNSRVNVKALATTSSRPLIVTDWRTEVFGEKHEGSFIWDELNNSNEHTGLCNGSGRACGYRGRKAVLKGSKLNLPKNISLIEYFNKRLAKHKIAADNEAIKFGHHESETLTYHELDLVSNVMAHNLLSKLGPACKNTNLDNDIIIAVCCPSSVRYVALMFAIMKMGAGIFPISVDLPVEKIFNSINEVRPILTIITREGDLLEMIESINLKHVFPIVILEDIWDGLDNTGNDPYLAVPYIKTLSGEPDIVYPPLYKRTVAIISPSNASGTFNGVRYKSNSIFNWIIWEWSYFALNSSEKILLQSETDTRTSLLEILSPLLHGNCLIVLEPKDGKNPLILLEKIDKFKIARLSVWPSLLHSILNTVQLINVDNGRNLLTSVKYWFCIGGILNLEEANLFFSLLSDGHRILVNMYGNDANIGVVCYQVLDSQEQVEKLNHHSRLPIGSPAPNIKLYVVNEKMKIVRGQEIGEICIALSEDYSTDQGPPNKFITNPFSKSPAFKLLLKTGDYGCVVRGAYGRRYLVYENSNGFERRVYIDNRLVELDEIDMNLRSLGNLMKDCHVLCYRAGHGDQIVVAFCCVDNPQALIKIRTALKDKMPHYMIPDLIKLDKIPRYDDGRVNENYLFRYHYEESIRRQEFEDWDSLDSFTQAKLHAVKVLFQVIFWILGVPMKDIAANYKKSFFNIPRASFSKLVFVVHELHRNRYLINLAEFIWAESLSEIVSLMVVFKNTRGVLAADPHALTIENAFVVEVLKDDNRDEVIDLLIFELTDEGSLDYYTEVKKHDLRRFLISMWVLFYAKGLSKVIRRIIDRKIVGVAININWHDEMDSVQSIPLTTQIAYRLQLMQILENGFQETQMSPTACSVIQICYAVLDSRELSHIETHRLMETMIAATIDTAKTLRFDAIIFTTYDYFVTDICVNNFGFDVVRECRLNQFIAADSRRPYHRAPDSLVASLCWRKNI